MGYIWRMESEIRLKMGRAASVYFRVEGGLRGAEEARVQMGVKEWGDREVEVAGRRVAGAIRSRAWKDRQDSTLSGNNHSPS